MSKSFGMRGASKLWRAGVGRGIAPLLVSALLASGLVLQSPAEAATTARDLHLHSLINDARAAFGVPELRLRDWLSRKARQHSRRMAERRELFHSDLGKALSPHHYEAVAENVGSGASLEGLVAEFVASVAHHNNILDPRWGVTGIGVVRRGDRIWVTQIFYD